MPHASALSASATAEAAAAAADTSQPASQPVGRPRGTSLLAPVLSSTMLPSQHVVRPAGSFRPDSSNGTSSEIGSFLPPTLHVEGREGVLEPACAFIAVQTPSPNPLFLAREEALMRTLRACDLVKLEDGQV